MMTFDLLNVDTSTEDDESEPSKVLKSQDRCLVGRVPRPAGAKPGRGGGVALIVRKNVSVSRLNLLCSIGKQFLYCLFLYD
jgi:hypothetical protein